MKAKLSFIFGLTWFGCGSLWSASTLSTTGLERTALPTAISNEQRQVLCAQVYQLAYRR